MDTHKYTCNYCHEAYIPKRRYAQKYCCNSCRAKAYHRRQLEKKSLKSTAKFNTNSEQLTVQSSETIQVQNQSIKKMSAAGVGNAAAGTLIADLIKHTLQGEGNRPATKNDINSLFNKLNRYHLITNLPPRTFGKLPYFDLHTNEVVYF